jgi:hypothetical protein
MKRMVSRLIRRINRSAQVLLTGQVDNGKRDEIPPINLDEVAEAKQFFPMEKFFIFGHARSGTTLLTRLVRLHPEVHCNYQAHFFSRPPLLQGLVADKEIGRWFTRSSNRWNRQRDLSPVVLRAVSDFILERDARREGKIVVGDKSPNSLLNGEAVHKLFNIYPDARLIFLVRDGRDAALSHRIQSFIDNPDKLSRDDKEILQSFIQDSKPYLTGKRSIFTRKGIIQAANGWVDNVVETDKIGRQLFGDSYHSMRFEDMLTLPREEMVRLWSFLDVDTDIPGLFDTVTDELTRNPDADWQHEKASQIAKSLIKGKHGSWRDMFTQRDMQIFYQIAGNTLNSWGYDDNITDRDGEVKL